MHSVSSSTLDQLAEHLRRTAFAPLGDPTGPARIGAELELIPVRPDTGQIAPVYQGPYATLPALERLAQRLGWAPFASTKGVPGFHCASGGAVTYEPGGQIEYSSPPFVSASGLLWDLRRTVGLLSEALAESEVRLEAVGLDPVTRAAEAALQLGGARYLQMAEYFAALGPAGARMMRQTASFQVGLDLGEDPFARWRLLNALAPDITALFANSRRYAGADTGHHSYRAATWRALDSSRTGVLETAAPIASYLEFALAAPDMMRKTEAGSYRPFCGWLARGEASPEQWETHLSTLFPEVRPRGYFEVRSADSLPVDQLAAPIVFLAGLVYDSVASRVAAEVAGAADPDLLVRAGRDGLDDRELRARAAALTDLALTGAGRLGPAFLDPDDIEKARAWFARALAAEPGIVAGR